MRSWVQIPLKSWIFFGLLTQLHKLCSQLWGSFFVWWKAHSNLDATRLFVWHFVLKSRFCKWCVLIGQHFCQAFSQKVKIVRCGHVGVAFFLYHNLPAKSVTKYYFSWKWISRVHWYFVRKTCRALSLLKGEEAVEGGGERNWRCQANDWKYACAFKFITCKPP